MGISARFTFEPGKPCESKYHGKRDCQGAERSYWDNEDVAGHHFEIGESNLMGACARYDELVIISEPGV